MSNTVGIRTFDFVEFYVGSAKMAAYWFAKMLGLDLTGYAGPETGVQDRVSYYLTKNNLKLVVTSAIKPSTHDVLSFTHLHGDGVKRWAIQVDDVEKSFRFSIKNGAIPIISPHKKEDKHGYVYEATIRIYDDTELCFINGDKYRGIFKPGFEKIDQPVPLHHEDTGLQAIDHIVGNVRENEMDKWESYFNRALDFETFIHFGPGDISTQYSALLSKVVRSKDNRIKLPINEPFEGLMKSQIEEYIDEYQGTGIQHIAIHTTDIVNSIRALRHNGAQFLSVPKSYYENLRKKKITLEENIDDLEALGILCDTSEDKGYLLQLFTKPIGDRPTFFFEIIQRKNGAQGFGHGNFQALFESIEDEQKRRGNLVRRAVVRRAVSRRTA